MRVSLIVRLKVEDAKEAEALKEALAPDDVGAPKGLSINSWVEGNGPGGGAELVYRLEAEGALQALATAIDEILAHAQLSHGLLREMEGSGRARGE